MGHLEEKKLLRVIGILFFGSLGCGAEVLIAQQVRDTVHSDTTEVASGGSPVTLPEFGADFKGFAQGLSLTRDMSGLCNMRIVR